MPVLTQKDAEGFEHRIAYISHAFSETEKKYSTTNREALAMVYAIRKFRPYIQRSHFTVFTDHNCLKWLYKIKDPFGCVTRRSLELQSYDFDIEYKKGKMNNVADALSRMEKVATFEEISDK